MELYLNIIFIIKVSYFNLMSFKNKNGKRENSKHLLNRTIVIYIN